LATQRLVYTTMRTQSDTEVYLIAIVYRKKGGRLGDISIVGRVQISPPPHLKIRIRCKIAKAAIVNGRHGLYEEIQETG